jgi:hypothetical protein
VERFLRALAEALEAMRAYDAEAPDNPGRERYTRASAEYDKSLVRLKARFADAVREVLADEPAPGRATPEDQADGGGADG